MQRKIEIEFRSASEFGGTVDDSAVIRYDFVYNRQPKTSPFSIFFGGEERFKNSSANFFRHAAARIGNREIRVTSGLDRNSISFTNFDPFQLNFDDTACIAYCVGGLYTKIHKHLLDLPRIRANRPSRLPQIQNECKMRWN